MQRDFLAPDGRMPVEEEQAAQILPVINGLLAAAGGLDMEVVYIANAFSSSDFIGNLFRNGAAIAGEPGAELDPRLRAGLGPSFDKSMPDAFSNDDFDRYLRQRQIGQMQVPGPGLALHLAVALREAFTGPA